MAEGQQVEEGGSLAIAGGTHRGPVGTHALAGVVGIHTAEEGTHAHVVTVAGGTPAPAGEESTHTAERKRVEGTPALAGVVGFHTVEGQTVADRYPVLALGTQTAEGPQTVGVTPVRRSTPSTRGLSCAPRWTDP